MQLPTGDRDDNRNIGLRRLVSMAALCGMVGPLLFGAVLVALSLAQYSFMLSLGWDPLTAPTRDWPSGLALGQYGAVMTGTFIGGGLLMALFALGLGRVFQGILAGKLASRLLVLAGIAMALLAFQTDPTIRTTPATLHGRIHDAAFVSLGLTLLPAVLLFGVAFSRQPRWRWLAGYTWLVAAASIPAFLFKGFWFYIFLAAMLSWSELVAIHLWRTSNTGN